MSKSEVPTVHGDVEYETVECSSCNNEVAKQHAKRFYIGSVDNKRRQSYADVLRVEFDLYDTNSGWVCGYCEDDPVAYPRGKVFKFLASTKVLATILAILATVWVVL